MSDVTPADRFFDQAELVQAIGLGRRDGNLAEAIWELARLLRQVDDDIREYVELDDFYDCLVADALSCYGTVTR